MSSVRRLISVAGITVVLAPCVLAQTTVANGPARRINEMAEYGQLREAEIAARVGGPQVTVTLGDVLVLRGRLAEADSAYNLAVTQKLPRYRSADAGLAELALRRGDRAGAVKRAGALTAEYERNGAQWSPEDWVAAGRAYAVLGAVKPAAFHDALTAFDRAATADSSNIDARLRAADMLLDKYNAPDARDSYEQVLEREPNHPRALLGLARALAFEGRAEATAAARKSLALNKSLVPAYLLLSELNLEAEEYDSASADAAHALAIDSSAVAAWSVLGAIAWLQGDSAGFRRAKSMAQRTQPQASEFYADIAESAARQRRYADAAGMAEQAVRADSLSAHAYGVLGMNELRLGEMERGRMHLEAAFTLDPYNLWHKNTLDMLDNVAKFRTVSTPRFKIVAPPGEADYLGQTLGPLLEQAYDVFAARYDYRPPTPIRVELYDRHADFSVRTVGLAGLSAILGVSFGTTLALDAPSGRDAGDFNYGSTAWHELGHTFTLGLSGNRMPRWLSEGLSVLEERRAGRGWGMNVSPEFLAAFKGGYLPLASKINEGLVRPTFPAEVVFSYYEASLVCEMIEAEKGIEGIRAMLRGYRDGLGTPAVLQKVLGLTTEAFDLKFDQWVAKRFAVPMASIDAGDGTKPVTGAFILAVKRGVAMLAADLGDSAQAELQHAQALFPEYAGADGPAWPLARYYHAKGDTAAAAAELSRITAQAETGKEPNALEATVRLEMHDSAGAIAALDRLLWITPYDVAVHRRLADLADQTGKFKRAVQERRAIVALAPTDRLEARYQLARALLRAGDKEAARHEILQVLEQAPGFEKAQAFLLELQGGPPPVTRPPTGKELA